MRYQRPSSPPVVLACLLLLCGFSSFLTPAVAMAHPAPTLTTSLRVNGVVTECGASVKSGDQVCLLLRSNQDGNAVVTIRKGMGADQTLASGMVKAGVTYKVCVTAGVADSVIRTFTLKVANADNLTSVQQCAYFVDKSSAQSAPVVTTSLKVNGVAAACGATVKSGDQVCLLLSSNQDGFAVVKIRKGTGADTILAQGTVKAGVTYRVCVIAGAADSVMRTFTVKVANAADLSTTEQCGYVVK